MTMVKLERWRVHVVAARKHGIPLSRYAREHGISRYTLYAAQRQLRSAGELPAKRFGRQTLARQGAFVAVQVAESVPSAMRARLPNGVALEFGHLDAGGCARLLAMLAALPCSG